ncbi:MAG TPA: CocE/NonD family hydrolase C-terminal non-catalytic domain-containing protein [Edaphobacter sp.]|nr:CocE/NonD family hydrolase C-terminal non-catalytic domain-containing protein [Edaphobacter sp.]
MIGPAAGIARQNEVEGRGDVLVYTTLPLNHDMEATGPISLILYVSTTAPNTDFTAKLVDVHQDGSAFNTSEGILRRSSIKRYKARQPPKRYMRSISIFGRPAWCSSREIAYDWRSQAAISRASIEIQIPRTGSHRR